MAKKQYYIPGKEYEWTKETWDTVLKHMGNLNLANHYGPFVTWGGNVKGSTEYGCEGKSYAGNLNLCWKFLGNEKYWRFSVSEEGVEIPEYLIPFYGEGKKETLSVEDLDVGKEYIMSIKSRGVDEDCLIIYWARNEEVVFATNLKYHTYEHFYIEDINHFREVPEKSREEKLSEKYGIPLDKVNKMVEDGVIIW